MHLLFSVFQQIGPGILTLLGLWYKGKLDRRAKPDLIATINRKEKVRPILEQILYELGGTRCCEWAVSNGDVTLSGYHLQKISILTEATKEGIDTIQPLFQLVPISQFARTIEELRHNPSLVSNESQIHDDLAALNMSYHTVTLLEVRIHGEYNKWTGILSVGWDTERTVTPQEIAYLKLQASRIGAIKN